MFTQFIIFASGVFVGYFFIRPTNKFQSKAFPTCRHITYKDWKITPDANLNRIPSGAYGIDTIFDTNPKKKKG